MNKLLFLFFFLVMVPLSGFTRQFEFVVMGGYQFGGMVDETTQQGGVFTPGPALGLSGSGNWGVIADYRLGSKLLLYRPGLELVDLAPKGIVKSSPEFQ